MRMRVWPQAPQYHTVLTLWNNIELIHRNLILEAVSFRAHQPCTKLSVAPSASFPSQTDGWQAEGEGGPPHKFFYVKRKTCRVSSVFCPRNWTQVLIHDRQTFVTLTSNALTPFYPKQGFHSSSSWPWTCDPSSLLGCPPTGAHSVTFKEKDHYFHLQCILFYYSIMKTEKQTH